MLELELSKILSHQFSQWSIGGIFVLFIGRFIQSKSFRDTVIKAFKVIFSSFIGKSNLNHHLFHSHLYAKTIVMNIEFDECVNKTKLFQIVLNSIMDVTIFEIKAWLDKNRKGLSKMNRLTLMGELNMLHLNIKLEYESDILTKFYNHLENKELATKAFNLIYHGTESCCGFEEFNKSNNNPVKRFIKHMAMYGSSSNSEIMYIFLSLINTSLFTAIQDTDDVFKSLNGQLCKN